MVTQIKITEGLDAADYPAVKAKIDGILASGQALPGHLAHWCEASGECACRGCANGFLTWAEYECWRKYDPACNRRTNGR
jgi:hypothetical protein